MKQYNPMKAEVDSWRTFSRRIQDALELAQLDDESLRAEMETEVSAIETELETRSFTAMLSGKHDHDSARHSPDTIRITPCWHVPGQINHRGPRILSARIEHLHTAQLMFPRRNRIAGQQPKLRDPGTLIT